MIAPEKMIALWNTDEEMKISEILVLDIARQNEGTDNLLASAGACDEGWMEGGDLVNTPIGLYADIASTYGFADRGVTIRALEQFEKVDGQEWATTIRRGLQDDPERD